MLFNSFEFLVFLVIVFVLYWFVLNKNLTVQNLLLVVSSYIFYGWWDYRFLSLIFISTLWDYFMGILIHEAPNDKRRKQYLILSLSANLGLLGVFKYYNFFVSSFIELFAQWGIHLHVTTISIILPIGISFYTFQSLSYTIDIYRRKMEPSRDIISFFAFVCFFPQLVAGPIERAVHLLPQFYTPRVFNSDQAKDGMRLILWGLFKKVMIADNCATFADAIFEDPTHTQGSVLALGVLYFAFQIYGDFSGYSDIAIGTARLFGFQLMRNFNYPYFSINPVDFWRRWHISLSTWFRDYIYIPLGGNKVSLAKQVRNTMIVFVVSGLWHGANWTYLIWGFLNGLYIIPFLFIGKSKLNEQDSYKFIPSLKTFLQMSLTFAFISFTWIFFRAKSLTLALEYVANLFSRDLFSIPKSHVKFVPVLIAFVIFEWTQRNLEIPLKFYNLPKAVRWILYYLIIFIMFNYGSFNSKSFIYFQF